MLPETATIYMLKQRVQKTLFPDYFDVQGVPVVSKKFIETLERASIDNFQAFPVEIRFEDDLMSGRFILNVIGYKFFG